jgi:hypothetical protein
MQRLSEFGQFVEKTENRKEMIESWKFVETARTWRNPLNLLKKRKSWKNGGSLKNIAYDETHKIRVKKRQKAMKWQNP